MGSALMIYRYSAVFTCLLLNTVRDITTGRIHPGATLFLFGAGSAYLTACIGAAGEGTVDLPASLPGTGGLFGILLPFIPGILLFILCRISNEAIGAGDTYIIFILGFFHTVIEMLVIVSASFAAAGIYAAIRLSATKKNGSCSFPFVPFITTAWTAYAVFSFVR